ncbi:hypothetical protein AM202_0068 [Actinobacillus minor 202]|uniref:Uncharacterized protein n=1 Tax=Actinobacillus minor 202 TaxID=591023 RepID=A0ABM9XIZ7_9PAST|nr:hypothetical protein [Actinobacillus minor]EEF16114.1 hypothetical protein AM202_0068 [Actinobacillus minor 202]
MSNNNLDSFSINRDELLVNVKLLENIIQGCRYRLNIDLLKLPKNDEIYEKVLFFKSMW